MSADEKLRYPLGEHHPDELRTARGTALEGLTVDAVLAGEIQADELRITAPTLHMQAAIARRDGRGTLARNFERAAEMVDIPQDVLLATYELLRPGRVAGADELRAAADRLRREYGADRCAAMLEEAAEVYAARGLFTRRF